MAAQPTKQQEEKITSAIVRQLLALATGGFGLAAALAWNETIQAFIEEYVKPYVSGGSGLSSQLIYALVVTVLAVFITYQLTKLSQKLEQRASK